ncbi:hypothetical protein MTO96_034469 [Rhipicephalus appendiculatus]
MDTVPRMRTLSNETAQADERDSRMNVQVMGEDISAEEITEDAGWKTAGTRRSRTRHRAADSPNDIDASPNKLGIGRQGTKPKNVRGKVIKAGRMPKLPKEDIKIVVRPQGGLDIVKVGAPVVTAAIFAAASMTEEESAEDTVCPNSHQNIVVMSTPKRANADRYAKMRQIHIQGKLHEVNVYETAPDNTTKGVIRGIPIEDGPRALDENIVNTRNPLALAAKRIGNTSTVVIAFDGLKVPKFVRRRWEHRSAINQLTQHDFLATETARPKSRSQSRSQSRSRSKTRHNRAPASSRPTTPAPVDKHTHTVYPMIIEERTEEGTVVLHVHDGLSLSLTKAKVATEALRLRSRTDGSGIDQIINGTEIERTLFEDRQKMATVSLIKTPNGVRVTGLLSPTERIEPALSEARQASGSLPHIVRNIQRPLGSRPLRMERRKDTMPGICRDRYLPENVTIEVYVISDEVHNRRFATDDLWRYICIFINSINAIFMSLSCPRVSLALVGLEISSKIAETQYVYGSDKLMNDLFTLYNLKDYVGRKMRAYGNPDVVLLLTGRDIYESTGTGIRRDITGIAFEGGVCTDHRVALAEDMPGSFSGIIDAAHEIGHSLGASHDGSPPNRYIQDHPGSLKCPAKSGHLMTYVDGGPLRYQFSQCNQEEIRYVLSIRGKNCWDINAANFYSLKDVYPGALINPNDFCKRFYKNNGAYSPREPFLRSHCKMRCCAVLRANTHTCALHHMLDDMWCDYGKKCFQGVCTSGMYSSPYRSKKFSRRNK